jgi:transposase
MNGVMYILSTGCQWRYLPKDFPPRSTVHNYFDWWIRRISLMKSMREFFYAAFLLHSRRSPIFIRVCFGTV